MTILLILIIILLLLWYIQSKAHKEDYRSCRDCDNQFMPRNGMVALNPFIWPYSGTSCVNDLYVLNKDTGLDIGLDNAPLMHLNTPDHDVLTN